MVLRYVNFPMPDGGVATFFQDITDRKLTESLLQEQRERFDLATDAALIGYWFCDLPFDKLIWDERVKEHFWLPPDANVDIGLFYQILHPEDRERTRDGHRRLDRKSHAIRHRIPHRLSKWGDEVDTGHWANRHTTSHGHAYCDSMASRWT